MLKFINNKNVNKYILINFVDSNTHFTFVKMLQVSNIFTFRETEISKEPPITCLKPCLGGLFFIKNLIVQLFVGGIFKPDQRNKLMLYWGINAQGKRWHKGKSRKTLGVAQHY